MKIVNSSREKIRLGILPCLLLLLVLFPLPRARAQAPQTRNWTGNTSTDWNTGNNWGPTSVPPTGSTVIIDKKTGRLPTLSSGTVSLGTLTVGSTAANSDANTILTIQPTLPGTASLSDATAYLGNASGATGKVSVSAAGSWTSTTLYAGYSGTGTVNVSAGGTVNATDLYAGYNSTAVGNVISAGNLSATNLYAGYNGAGHVTVSGGNNTVGTLYAGYNIGSSGTVSISGGSLGVTSTFSVGYRSDWSGGNGYNATGAVTLSSGSLNTSGGGIGGYMGSTATNSGTATVTGGTWSDSEKFNVGIGSTGSWGSDNGSLNISNGGVVNFTNSDIAGNSNGFTATQAAVTVSGSGSQWNVSDTATIYGASPGALGRWQDPLSALVVNQGASSALNKVTLLGGTVTVDGAGSTMSATGTFSNFGSIMLSDGGNLQTAGMSIGGNNGPGYVRLNYSLASGAASTWTNTGTIYVGSYYGDAASLSIWDGTVTTDNLQIGSVNHASLSGTVLVQLAGRITANDLITVGNGGNAVLDIDGGRVSTTYLNIDGGPSQSSTVYVGHSNDGLLEATQIGRGGSAGGNVRLIFNGGQLWAKANESDFLSGFQAGEVVVNSGGVSISTANDTLISTGPVSIGISSAISGSGWVGFENITATLTAENTYTGNTGVGTSATLQIGNNGTSGSVASAQILNDGHLIFNRSDSITYTGVISGFGDVRKLGSQSLTLSGINTYSGATYVDAGTLNVTGQLGAGDAVTLAAGTALIGTGQILRDVIVNNGATVASTLLIAGKLTLPTSDQQNVGSVTSGTTTAASGQQLNVTTASGGTVDATAGTASIDTLDGASVQAGNWGASVTTMTSGSVSVSGGGVSVTTLTNGSISLSDNAAVVAQEGNFNGGINGNGSVVKTGANTLTLNTANGYTGGTQVTSGALVAAVNGAVGNGNVSVSGNGMYHANGGVTTSGQIVSQSLNASYEKAYSGTEELSDFGSFASDMGSKNTTALLVAGTATGQTLTASYAGGISSFAAQTGGTLSSDQLTLSGIDGTTFMLSMKISLSAVNSTSALMWLDPSDSTWKFAVDGDHGTAGSLAGSYDISSSAFLTENGGWNATTMLGAYGVDTSTGELWAVIDHNSTFGAFTTVPEPSTWALLGLGLGLGGLLAFRKRRQS